MMKIFTASRIVTMAGERPEAFATWGERIVALGSVADLRERFPEAGVIDFGNAVVVPGFNDAHGHIGILAEDALYVDLSWDVVRSHAEMLETLRQEARLVPAGRWLRGTRYDDAKMGTGAVVTRWELDEISRTHPIFVHHVAGHWCVVNSAALQLAGFDDSTPDMPGGKFGRDGGRLNGILHEKAMETFWPFSTDSGAGLMPIPSLEDRLLGFEKIQKKFHASGMTSITDAFVAPHHIALFEEARARGLLTMRINMLVSYEAYDSVRSLGLRSGFGDEHLRFGGVKAFVDGALGGRTCLMEEPFEGSSDDFGIQSTSTADLRDIVRLVHGDGNRACVHANGDRAIGLLLAQLEDAENDKPQPGLRHRIEHCSIVNDEIVERIRRLGAMVTPFGSYVYYHGAKLLDWYGAKRVERMFAHRTFIDRGIVVAGASDHPCGPYQPLLAMQSCVTRTGFDGAPIGLSQRISAEEALALYTRNAAAASEEDHRKGALLPGYLADFVVLEADPRGVAPENIGEIGIRGTYVGANVVWEAAS